jgi:UDP-2-acetamido-3-amino-2,3-dideoxy-glucuronate N-acetyltransferase
VPQITIELASYFKHETAIIDEPVRIGSGTKIWHFCHLMANCELGERCNLGQNVFVASGVRLGNNVKVQNNVSLYEGVICEDDVFIGPSAVFTNIRNPRSAIVRRDQYEQTYLEQGATIGANATIRCGVRLGHHCLIGAGAVVTKDVAPYAMMIGVPAAQVGWVSEYGHRLVFDAEGKAVCPESGEAYVLSEGSVKRK